MIFVQNSTLNNPQRVIILKGCPCSGKTAWSKKFLSDNPGWIRICTDDIIEHIINNVSKKYDGWTYDDDIDIIKKFISNNIRCAIDSNYNIIIDGCNVDNELNAMMVDLCNEYCIEPCWKEFVVTLEESIKTNEKRDVQHPIMEIIRFYTEFYPDKMNV